MRECHSHRDCYLLHGMISLLSVCFISDVLGDQTKNSPKCKICWLFIYTPFSSSSTGFPKPEGSITPWDGSHNQLTWAHRGLKSLNLQPGSLHGTDLDSLHICDNCVGWSSCETTNRGSRGYLWLLYWFFWYTILGCLAHHPYQLRKCKLK